MSEDMNKTSTEEIPDLDILGIYMREISQYPLLTKQEEIALAIKIKAGNKKAFEKMVNHNLRLVIQIAKKRHKVFRLELMDIIAWGNIGLIQAVKKYDHKRGFRFSTFATWWIIQAVSRSNADYQRTVRVPSYVFALLSRWKESYLILQATLGRKPTDLEVVDHCGITEKQIKIISKSQQRTMSISVERDGEENFFNIEDKNCELPEEHFFRKENRERIDAALSKLTDEERTVLTLRFGLNGGAPSTLQAVGDKIGVTREWVRQIQTKAIEKMRKYFLKENAE